MDNAPKASSGSSGWLLLFILIFFLLIASCSSSNSTTTNTSQDEASYNTGLTYLRNHEYGKVGPPLVALKLKNYRDSKVLYNYANAQLNKDSDPSMAEFYLKDIPDTYKGEFANEINALREKVKEPAEKQRKSEAETKKEAAKEYASKIHIGDSKEKVLNLWGSPEHRNRTVIGNRVHEQWVYGDTYIYIDDGIVTAFQD